MDDNDEWEWKIVYSSISIGSNAVVFMVPQMVLNTIKIRSKMNVITELE